MTINSLFDNSDLALAAYSQLTSTLGTDQQLDALKEAGMTQTQTKQFALRWPEVANQYTNPLTGLSVTVFRNGSEVNIAIRGTQTSSTVDLFIDIYNDIKLGTGQIPIQYTELKIIYENLKTSGTIQATDNVKISGHSLGGFLAQLLAVDFSGDFDHTYTYNAPGIGGVPLDIFGIQDNTSTTNISNIRGDGFSFIATVGTSLGSVIDIQIENSLLAPGDHTIKKLTDSLIVFDTLYRLDPALTVEQYNSIFSASSNVENTTLENMVSDIHNIFINTPLNINTDDREGLYAGIQIIKTELYVDPIVDNPELKPEFQGLTITDITATSQNNLFVLSQDLVQGLAYRYALVNLNPFVITGNDTIYISHNNNNELENFSEDYLTDASEFLALKNELSHEDRDSKTGNSTSTKIYQKYDDNGVQDFEFRISGIGPCGPRNNFFIFGGQGTDNIKGSDRSDHLYGNGGDDELIGDKGADYLEGNADDDMLYGGEKVSGMHKDDEVPDILKGGDGTDTYFVGRSDTIDDSDGDGVIKYRDTNDNETIISARTYKLNQENIYESDDADKLKILYDTVSQTIIVLGKTDTEAEPETILTIKNFQSGDFNIILDGEPVVVTYTSLLLGTDGDDGSSVFVSTPFNDEIQTLAGNDTASGGDGQDLIVGGDGDDFLSGNNDNDIVHGDAGIDAVFGDAGNDSLSGGSENDIILGVTTTMCSVGEVA